MQRSWWERGLVARRRLDVVWGHVQPPPILPQPFPPRSTSSEAALHAELVAVYGAEGVDALCPDGHRLSVASCGRAKRCRACGARVIGAYVSCASGHLAACGACAVEAARRPRE